ncbi:MAG TPA: glycosyltransferase family 39 protein [Patescibacteria group bacterium]|nr:glycosyltransferase family 39 protein [Patescibacteria group bacterium]
MRKKYKSLPTVLTGIAFFLGALLRFIFLDRIPTAVGNDELQYILSARTFFSTGTDITRTISVFSPFLFHYPAGINPQAELPYLILTYGIGPLPFSLFNARIVSALLSILTILIAYLIAKRLFNHATAILTAFAFALNPWLIYIGRTGYEATYAMFFYLLGILVLLLVKRKKIILSLGIFLLGFYSYIATKLIFLPLIGILSYYCYSSNKKDKKYYVSLSLIALLFVLGFGLLIQSNPHSRLDEILTPFSQSINDSVNSARLMTISTPLTSLFINKLTFYLYVLTSKLLNAFSPSYLFLTGDLFFSLFRQGLFYLVDSIFLFVGLIGLFQKKRREFYLLSSLSILSVVPQLLHVQEANFTPHLTLFIPFLLFIIAYGINEILNLTTKKFHVPQKFSIGVVALVYVLFVGNFCIIYFFQFPLQSFFDFPVRVMSRYVGFAQASKRSILIISAHRNDIVPEMLFYTNSPAKKIQTIIAQLSSSSPLTMGSLHITDCGGFPEKLDTQTTYIVDSVCGIHTATSAAAFITHLNDGGEVFRIYQDQLCSVYPLKRYADHITLTQLNLDHLSLEEFCQTFIDSRN